MSRVYLIVLTMISLGLGACSHAKEQDFKPYLKGEEQSFPTAYGTEAWSYPNGTPTAEIMRRWNEAGLITTVTSGGKIHIWNTPENTLTVFVGPNFYNLSASSQRGLADTLAQIYGVGQSGRPTSYLLMDAGTGKGIGQYTMSGGLQTY